MIPISFGEGHVDTPCWEEDPIVFGVGQSSPKVKLWKPKELVVNI